MKVLLICLHRAEQAFAATVVADNLKQIYQNSQIDMLIHRHTIEIVKDNANINNIVIYEDKATGKMSKMLFLLGLFFKKYDLVIDMSEKDKGATVSYFTSASQRIGKFYSLGVASKLKHYTHIVDESPYRHMVENCLDRLRAIDLKIISKNINFAIDESSHKKIADILSKNSINDFVHFHPVSSELSRCPDGKVVAQCIDYIQETKGLKVVATAMNNAVEADRLFAILQHCKNPPLTIVGSLSLMELGALSAKAKMFFGVDNTHLHIAASQNTPTIALFGPSEVFKWGAWDNETKECTYTARNGVQSMGRHTAVQLELNCIPCASDGCNGTKISDCLMDMPFEKVKILIDQKL